MIIYVGSKAESCFISVQNIIVIRFFNLHALSEVLSKHKLVEVILSTTILHVVITDHENGERITSIIFISWIYEFLVFSQFGFEVDFSDSLLLILPFRMNNLDIMVERKPSTAPIVSHKVITPYINHRILSAFGVNHCSHISPDIGISWLPRH